MQTCTDSWRYTALTLLAAVVGLVFLLVGTASACPHHMAAQKQAVGAAAHHDRVAGPVATKPEKVEQASHPTPASGHKVAECRHVGMHDCSTCCGLGSTNAQRPQDVALVDSAPATPSVPDLPVSMLVSAITVISDPFPDRRTESLLGEAGKARLVTVSRRLRL